MTLKDLKGMTIREKWAYFFKYADETSEDDLEKIVGEDLIIKRAYDELNRFGWSEKELNDYESVEMKQAAEAAINEAYYEKGEEEGKKKKSLEIAQKMVDEGLSISQINRSHGSRNQISIRTCSESKVLSIFGFF